MNLRRATATREKDSKQTERIKLIPLTREEKWLFAHVSHGMHEMVKCEAACFRARQNPCAGRSKYFLNSGEKLKGGPSGERFEEPQFVYPAAMGVLI
jgi:hypothetical protein